MKNFRKDLQDAGIVNCLMIGLSVFALFNTFNTESLYIILCYLVTSLRAIAITGISILLSSKGTIFETDKVKESLENLYLISKEKRKSPYYNFILVSNIVLIGIFLYFRGNSELTRAQFILQVGLYAKHIFIEHLLAKQGSVK